MRKKYFVFLQMHDTDHSILFIVSVNTYFQDTNPSLSLQNRNLNNNFKNLIIKTFHPVFFMDEKLFFINTWCHYSKIRQNPFLQ